MTRPTGLVLIAAALTAAAFAALRVGGQETLPPPRPEPGYPPGEEAPFDHFRFVGSASCSSSACHNKGGPTGSKGSEYTTWGRRDPHNKAYSVLFDARSTTIQKNRHATEPAPEDALCLKCHTLNVPASREGIPGSVDESLHVEKLDGVGCESCHGPAEKWLRAHVQAGWKGLSRQEKFKGYGFAPTDDLAYRVRMCANCHVGRGDMEVDHVLIAAGHPRLAFEYTSFHHIYPRHWRETDYGPDFESRAWVIGQLASARAALDLLADRADRAAIAEIAGKVGGKANSPVEWPEFSEYDCYACHQQLVPNSWRQKEGPAPGHVPGTLPWGTWYEPTFAAGKEPAALPDLAGGLPAALGAGLEPLGPRYAALRKLMEKPYPSPTAVRSAARALSKDLGDAVAELQARADADTANGRQADPARVRLALRQLIDGALPEKEGGRLRLPGWDQTVQHYLAVSSLYLGLKDQGVLPPVAPTDGLVRGLGAPLRFPRPTFSPAGELEVVDGPVSDFDPAKYRAALTAVRKALDP